MDAQSKDRVDGIIVRYRPRGWRVLFGRVTKPPGPLPPGFVVSAHADFGRRIIRLAHDPREHWLIQNFLHEVGHVVLKHDYLDERWLEEYEAERFSFEIMRYEGIRIPRALLREAKQYVASCVKEYEILDKVHRRWIYGEP